MFDLLDLYQGRYRHTFSGTHYFTRPPSIDGEGAYFDYETVDPTERHYQKLFGNILNNDGATTTIKTNDDLAWKVGNYVVLQDDGLYKISSVTKDYQSANKEAFRFLKDAPQTDYILRLVEINNPWGTE